MTPADGPCPKGCKAFDVTVVETFGQHYVVYARSRDDAVELVEERCNSGYFSPSDDAGAEYDRRVEAEETELRVVDLPVCDDVRFHGENYPVWTLRKGGRTARVSTLALQTALVDGNGEPVSDAARKVDDTIAFYVGPEDTVASVMEDVFG